MMKIAALAAAATLSLTLASTAHAALVSAYAENFEGTLAGWSHRDARSPDGRIVIDPLNPSNHVLSFSRTMGSGSIFSNTQVASASGRYTFSFDYLGRPGQGGNAGDLGGYLGVSEGFRGTAQTWLAGTGSHPTPLALVDDGQWHSYSITFDSPFGSPVRMMLEDWDGSYGVAGDAYFDNLRLNDVAVAPAAFASAVPEPGSLALLGVAVLGAGLASRRRRA